jgi:hypothetical protein
LSADGECGQIGIVPDSMRERVPYREFSPNMIQAEGFTGKVDTRIL